MILVEQHPAGASAVAAPLWHRQTESSAANCKEDLCNTENGRTIVELYLGNRNITFRGSCIEIAAQPQLLG